MPVESVTHYNAGTRPGYSLSLSAYFDFTAGDSHSRSSRATVRMSPMRGETLWIVHRYFDVRPGIETALNNHPGIGRAQGVTRTSGIDITDRRKSKPLDKEPLRTDFAPYWCCRVAPKGVKGWWLVTVRVTVWTRFYESLARCTRCLSMYVRVHVHVHVPLCVYDEGRREKEPESLWTVLPRDKAIISALSGPNQANQPPTASAACLSSSYPLSASSLAPALLSAHPLHRFRTVASQANPLRVPT